jgi:diguanylate cyclase (GGDEF)-like protein
MQRLRRANASEGGRPDPLLSALKSVVARIRVPRLRARPVFILLVSQLMLGLVIAAIAGFLVLRTRDQALTNAGINLRSQSVLLADQAERSFEAIEVVLSGLLERLGTRDMRDQNEFRQSISGMSVYQDLRERKTMLPQLEAIVILDSGGKLVNFSRYWPIPHFDAAGRDYFKALKNDPDMQSFISEPVPNLATGERSAYVARKITGRDGTFLGVLVGAVQLSYFEDLYRSIATAPGFAVALFRRDGILLARYPHLALPTGRSFAQGEVFKRLMATGTKGDLVRQTGQMEGIDRLIAGRALDREPLMVTVATAVDTVLAEWRTQSADLLTTTVILEMVLAAIGLMTFRRLRADRLLIEARAARAKAEAGLAVAQERERAAEVFELQNVRFGAALGNMSQALCMFDAEDRLIIANRRLAEILGVPASRIAPGATPDDVIRAESSEAGLGPVDSNLLRNSIRQLRDRAVRGSDIRELSDGRTLAVTFAPVDAADWLVTLEDITERRTIEAKMSHMAHHDALTGLPNRVLFHQRLGEAVARSRRGETCAVLFLDLDHFKTVNDTLGHPVGDALLREVTQRLRLETREADTVARLGGDEFAIVQSGIEHPKDTTALAIRLIDAISAPYDLSGHHVNIGTSVGIAIVPDDGDDADQLLRNADMALYRSKADGRGRYSFFEPNMNATMQARRGLEMDLRDALATGAFEVFYQPLMTIKRRALSGFEALLRWNHPRLGLVPPAEFIPLAEEIGLIIPLGKWVLRQACADAAKWPGTPKVAVNLSPVQFASKTLVADVAAALNDSGLEPSRLELEITETAMLDDTNATLAILHRLKDLGIGISMDDFGTGYSSLNYLRRFPFTKVKIDRSFVEGLGGGGDNDAIVAAVTELCQSLGMTTLAEGVETEEQFRQLLQTNCTEAQGYLFSKARPACEVAAMCERLADEAST